MEPNSGTFVEQRSAAQFVPERLRVNLLGGLELYVGQKPHHHPYLHRQKVKTLLALMVLSEGREVNTEHLESIIWPYSDLSKNRNNFNNLWSLLRKALAPVEGGSCPYLHRHQGVCKLDRTLVDSDVFELHDLCDQLQFSEPDPMEALRLYQRLQQVYRGNLLPGEEENAVILRSRRIWRNRTVDALYMTALSLMQRGALAETVWFTQAALGIDESREDVLRLEMRAHLDQGNPSRALASYSHACLVLDQRYGLQPHAETVALAREAMGEEAPASLFARIPVAAAPPIRSSVGKRRAKTIAMRGKNSRVAVSNRTRLADGTIPKRINR